MEAEQSAPEVVLVRRKEIKGSYKRPGCPGLDMLGDEFLLARTLEGRSAVSVRGMKYQLAVFVRFLHVEGVGDPRRINPEMIDRFRRHLEAWRKRDGETLSPRTILSRMCSACVFLKWLREKGRIAENPMDGYELPDAGTPIPRDVMTADEVKRILGLPDLKSERGYRDRTVLEVLYSTGIRNAELRALKISDVDLGNKEIKVENGKGGKDRVVPLTATAVRFLKGYLFRVRPKMKRGERDARLFPEMSPGNVVREYREAAGVSKRVTPHSFRHTVATQLLQAGMDIRYIQVFLGHTSLKSTQIYTRIAPVGLCEKHRRYHPREKVRAVVPGERSGKPILYSYSKSESRSRL